MSKIYGEAIPTPGSEKQWAAVFYSDNGELSRYAADSRDEAEAVIKHMLGKLAEFVRKEGYDA